MLLIVTPSILSPPSCAHLHELNNLDRLVAKYDKLCVALQIKLIGCLCLVHQTLYVRVSYESTNSYGPVAFAPSWYNLSRTQGYCMGVRGDMVRLSHPQVTKLRQYLLFLPICKEVMDNNQQEGTDLRGNPMLWMLEHWTRVL